MEITVTSHSKSKKEFIKAVAALYVRELNLKRSRYNVVIQTISGLIKTLNIKGCCSKFDDSTIGIALDSRLDTETLTTVLAHEMIHVKQYALGQLKVSKNKFVWLGRKCQVNYYDAPWEIEAFSKERNLANKVARLISNT